MITFLQTATIGCAIFLLSLSLDKLQVVKDFCYAQNLRDTSTLIKLTHEDLRVEREGKVYNKKQFLEKIWCKSCYADSFNIIKIEKKNGAVHVIGAYKSEIFRLLEIPYIRYKSNFYFKEDKIHKIVTDTMPGYKALTTANTYKIKAFMQWLSEKYPNTNLHDTIIISRTKEYANEKLKKK